MKLQTSMPYTLTHVNRLEEWDVIMKWRNQGDGCHFHCKWVQNQMRWVNIPAGSLNEAIKMDKQMFDGRMWIKRIYRRWCLSFLIQVEALAQPRDIKILRIPVSTFSFFPPSSNTFLFTRPNGQLSLRPRNHNKEGFFSSHFFSHHVNQIIYF